jgi:dinuclear metal center YbgI/SA1388 family protein
MAALSTIVRHLDRVLDHGSIGDYPGAHNGLQIENGGGVVRVCAAVDACEAVFQRAAATRGTLLLVHHGMLWDGAQPIAGALRRKLALAFAGDMALYSSHLPLDAHATLGNNALLGKLVGLRNGRPAFEAKGTLIGLVGDVSTTRAALVTLLERALGGRVHVAPGGPGRVRRLGLVTGGAASQVTQAAALGCDTFITGEGHHETFARAEELGVNLLYAGHYATETLGVRALAEYTGARFRVPWEFIDHPSGL